MPLLLYVCSDVVRTVLTGWIHHPWKTLAGLDTAVCNHAQRVAWLDILDGLTTDHLPVYICLRGSVAWLRTRRIIPSKLCFFADSLFWSPDRYLFRDVETLALLSWENRSLAQTVEARASPFPLDLTILLSQLPGLTSIDFSLFPEVTDGWIDELTQRTTSMPYLRALALTGCSEISNVTLSRLISSVAHSVTVLHLVNTFVESVVLETICSQCTQLVDISFSTDFLSEDEFLLLFRRCGAHIEVVHVHCVNPPYLMDHLGQALLCAVISLVANLRVFHLSFDHPSFMSCASVLLHALAMHDVICEFEVSDNYKFSRGSQGSHFTWAEVEDEDVAEVLAAMARANAPVTLLNITEVFTTDECWSCDEEGGPLRIAMLEAFLDAHSGSLTSLSLTAGNGSAAFPLMYMLARCPHLTYLCLASHTKGSFTLGHWEDWGISTQDLQFIHLREIVLAYLEVLQDSEVGDMFRRSVHLAAAHIENCHGLSDNILFIIGEHCCEIQELATSDSVFSQQAKLSFQSHRPQCKMIRIT